MKNETLIKGINMTIAILIVISILYIILSQYISTKTSQAIPSIGELEFVDIHGNKLNIVESTKQGVIINFWASWCTACINELPLLNEAYKLEPFDMLAINIADQDETIEKYVNRYDLVFPIIKDVNGWFKDTYAVNALPLTVIVNHEGEVIERIQGELTTMQQLNSLKEKASNLN